MRRRLFNIATQTANSKLSTIFRKFPESISKRLLQGAIVWRFDFTPLARLRGIENGVCYEVGCQAIAERRSSLLPFPQRLQEIRGLMDERVLVADL